MITWSQVIVISTSRWNGIVINYTINVIVISDYFHDDTFTRYLIIYHVRDKVCYIRQNIRIELIYPFTDCFHIYMHDDLSVYLFYEICWNTASDVASVISYINGHFRLIPCCFNLVKPKLITQPAIVYGFSVTPSFNSSSKQSWLASNWMTSSQLNVGIRRRSKVKIRTWRWPSYRKKIQF